MANMHCVILIQKRKIVFWLTLRCKLDTFSLETCYSRIAALENQVISNYFIQVVMYYWI